MTSERARDRAVGTLANDVASALDDLVQAGGSGHSVVWRLLALIDARVRESQHGPAAEGRRWWIADGAPADYAYPSWVCVDDLDRMGSHLHRQAIEVVPASRAEAAERELSATLQAAEMRETTLHDLGKRLDVEKRLRLEEVDAWHERFQNMDRMRVEAESRAESAESLVQGLQSELTKMREALHMALARLKRDYHEIVCPDREYPDEHQCDDIDDDPVIRAVRAALPLTPPETP